MTIAQVVETSVVVNNNRVLHRTTLSQTIKLDLLIMYLQLFLCFSPRENSSVTVMWTSFYAASKRLEATSDGLHYGESITTLVITNV